MTMDVAEPGTGDATGASGSNWSPRGRVPGEPGIWVFILGDVSVFTYIFAVYLVYRKDHVELFEESREYLSQNMGAANTLVLLFSSLFVIRAGRSFRLGGRGTTRWFAAALGCGALFVTFKVIEYHAEITGGHSLNKNVFFNFYFLMTGLHLMHLVIGMGVLIYLLIVSRRIVHSNWHSIAMESGSCYWHMVDFLWVIIFALLYLVR